MRLRLLDGIFIGLVVLDLVGKEFDKTEKNQPTSWGFLCMLVHVCGRGCVVPGTLVFQVLIARGGGAHDLEDSPVHSRTGVG